MMQPATRPVIMPASTGEEHAQHDSDPDIDRDVVLEYAPEVELEQ